MDKDLKKLQPAALWSHFAEICNIPRPSHHEEKIKSFSPRPTTWTTRWTRART